SQGIDDQMATPLQFIPLTIPGFYSSQYTKQPPSELRAGWRQMLRQRDALQQALVQSKHVDDLLAELAQGSEHAADMCGAIGSEPCTQAILDRLATDPLDGTGLFGLCVRHIAPPDPLLADYILRTTRQLDPARPYSWPLSPAITALVCYPAGR